MAEAGSIILDALVPGAGTVATALQSIFELCGNVHEAKEMCVHFHGRLTTVQTEMVALEKKNCLPTSDAIEKYKVILQATVAELAVYKGMRGLARLLNYRKLKRALAGLHEDVNELFRMLQLATAGELMDMKNKLKQQSEEQLVLIKREFAAKSAEILTELQSLKAESDALLMLKYDLERAGAQHDDVLYTVIDKTYDTLARKSKAEVEKPPTWFMIAADVSFDPKPIASGSFADVCVGTWRSGAKVAVKLLLGDGTEDGLETPSRVEFVAEANRWFPLRHLNVGHTNRTPNKNKMWKLLLDAAIGLEYLHSVGIIHGDLKLNNILVGADSVARVGDFGLSRVKSSSKSYTTLLEAHEEVVGGMHWQAPELFREKTSKESDVYALAMCFVEAVSGRAPYGRLASVDIRAMIKTGVLPDRPEGMPDLAWKLVQEMTIMDKKKRITLPEVISQLKVLAAREEKERNATKEMCPACRAVAAAASNFCSECGTSFGGAPSTTVVSGPARLPPVSRLLEQLKLDAKKTTALKQLYHQIVHGKRHADVLDSADGIQSLREILNETDDVVRVLYAFGCLKALSNSDRGLSDGEMEEIRGRADKKTLDAKPTLEGLLSPASGATRDDVQALELVELFIQVDPNNRNLVASLISPVVRLLNEQAEDVRTGAVMALAAVAVGHSNNIKAILADRTALLTAAVSLAAVLSGQSSSQEKKSALDLLAAVTESISAAEECAVAEVIEAVLGVLRRKNHELEGSALRVIKNLALTGKKQTIGSCGAVLVLVEALDLESGTGDRKLVLDALISLVDHPGNAAMFELANGIGVMATLLSQAAFKDGVLLNLANLVAKSELLRQKVAARNDIVDRCVGSLKTGTDNEKQQAAYVLRELVRASPVLIQTLRDTGGLFELESLTRVTESAASREFASRALLNAIETLLKALEDVQALPPSKQAGLEGTPSLPSNAP